MERGIELLTNKGSLMGGGGKMGNNTTNNQFLLVYK
jgi:hypothetical protein